MEYIKNDTTLLQNFNAPNFYYKLFDLSVWFSLINSNKFNEVTKLNFLQRNIIGSFLYVWYLELCKGDSQPNKEHSESHDDTTHLVPDDAF
jgi:hypothetical protein